MEVITDNDNNNGNNMSNMVNNQSYSISQNNESLNNSFQIITKDPEREDLSIIKNKEKSKTDLDLGVKENSKSDLEIKDNPKTDLEIKDNSKNEEEHKNNNLNNNNNNNNIHLSKKNILHTELEEIKEIGGGKKNVQKKKGKKKVNLNFLSPEVYMGERMKHTERNINPVEIKLKKIEQEIQKQNDYDYKITMQKIKDKFDNIKKNKEQQKHIIEEDKKLKEKLKSMEEYRENKLKELAKKVFKKQNSAKKIIKKNKSGNESNEIIFKKNNKINNLKSHNNYNHNHTMESDSTGKLPPILSSIDRYKIIREKKDIIEKEFILNTKEDLMNLELEHKENYLYQCDFLNNKLKEKSKKYDERNEQHYQYRIDKEKEKNEKYLQKDIKRRYNIKLNILRDRSEKSGRLQDKVKKNLENFYEKKELLQQKEKKKIKEILKKMNKKNNISKSVINSERRQYYSDLQKANIKNSEAEFENKYKDYLLKQEDLKNYVNDVQKEDSNYKKYLYQNTLQNYNENDKKYKDFYEFLDKSKKKSIINQSDNIKLKMYNIKVRKELEEKLKKEEELLNGK